MTLDEIRKLIEAATAGPWEMTFNATNHKPSGLTAPVDDGYAMYVREPRTEQAYMVFAGDRDFEFIAASRTLMPKLLKVAEAGLKLADYIEECWPGLQVTDTIREARKELEGE